MIWFGLFFPPKVRGKPCKTPGVIVFIQARKFFFVGWLISISIYACLCCLAIAITAFCLQSCMA